MSNYSFRLSPILWPVVLSIVAIISAMVAMLNLLNYTVTVPEALLNQGVQAEFPKSLPVGELKEPELHLVNAKVAICVNFESPEPIEVINGKMIRLCAQGEPYWNDEESAVYIRNLQLLS